jgi:hypothetical protein
MNCLLFGLLVDRAGKFLALPPSSSRFAELLSSAQPDVRAGAVYALGFAKSGAEVPLLFQRFRDPSWHVRYEAMIACARLLNLGFYEKIGTTLTAIKELETDDVDRVQTAAKAIVSQLQDLNATEMKDNHDLGLQIPDSLLMPMLLSSVRNSSFRTFYMSNPFRAEDFLSKGL